LGVQLGAQEFDHRQPQQQVQVLVVVGLGAVHRRDVQLRQHALEFRRVGGLGLLFLLVRRPDHRRRGEADGLLLHQQGLHVAVLGDQLDDVLPRSVAELLAQPHVVADVVHPGDQSLQGQFRLVGAKRNLSQVFFQVPAL
jgi:hypothetical protein